MVLTELLRYYGNDLLTKLDGCQRKKRENSRLVKAWAGVIKLDKITYF